jgi:aryl-alcohol dehydrogenase-like predicted oxidoreductase
LGVNWIDTAPLYGLGQAEAMVGKAICEAPEKPILATKCGRFGDRDGNVSSRIKAASIRAEVEASLRRLKVDVVDLYQIHWPKPEEDIEEAWGTIAELVEEGKIRYGGVCNFSPTHLQRIQHTRSVDSLQSPYSMIERRIERSVLQYCNANNIGVIVYSPLQKGLLTAKFDRRSVAALPPDDHRKDDGHFTEPLLTANLKLARGLQELAERSDTTAAKLAIAWALRRYEITAAIVGARQPRQIVEAVEAADVSLITEQVGVIERLLDNHAQMVDAGSRPC